MSIALSLLTLAAIHLMAVMSPGAQFILVSRAALAQGRATGLALALGSALGALAWAAASIMGLALLLAQWASVYALLKVLGGLYLLYLAVQVWRHSGDALADVAVGDQATPTLKPQALWRGILLGFLTMVSNPKVIVFFGSIFVTVLPASPPGWLIATILAIVFMNELAWYAVVTLVLSSSGPRAAYLSVKPWLDRVMAGFLGLLGVKLVGDGLGSWRS